MSQAKALLASLTNVVHEHSHPVPDTDASFVIDPYSRLIENANYQKNVIMQRDHNSERFTFEIPRYVDGHDMSLCNRVIVHFDNISTDEATMNSDVAYMNDLHINPKNEETVISSWLITREATQIVGILSFSIQYLCVEEDGTVSYEWSTDSFEEIEIRKSKNNGEASVVQYSNVLEQWRSELFSAGDSVMTNITTEGANQVAAVKNESATQQAAIELKGSETLATIPEDYTEVYNMAEEALRTKADGVICDADGSVISIADSSDDYIRGLNLYGKSTQFTTTGKNLLNIPDKINTIKGVSFTVNPDRSVSVSGTPTEVCAASIYGTYGEPVAFPAGTYIVSGGIDADRYIRVRIHSSDGTLTTQRYADGADKEFTINDGDLISVSMYFATLDSVNGLTFHPMIRLATVEDATYEPYTGGISSPNPDYPQEIKSIENPAVTIYGKNLARTSIDNSLTVHGINVTIVKDTSEIILDGTVTDAASGATSFSVMTDIPLSPGQYTASVTGLNIVDDVYDRIYVKAEDGEVLANYIKSDIPVTFYVDKPTKALVAMILVNGTIYKNAAIGIQIEPGDTATEYEPYKPVQTLTMSHTLPGIIDLRDITNQTVIYDEIDLERGVYIQRLGDEIIDGNETVGVGAHVNGQKYAVIKRSCIANSGIISDRYVGYRWCEYDKRTYTLSDNIVFNDSRFTDKETAIAILAEEKPRIIYALATPIEKPLTAEEIEAYKSLKTNYPNTTIFNDAGAMMNVKYNADTKLYISNTVETEVVNVVEGVLNDTY